MRPIECSVSYKSEMSFLLIEWLRRQKLSIQKYHWMKVIKQNFEVFFINDLKNGELLRQTFLMSWKQLMNVLRNNVKGATIRVFKTYTKD